MMAGCAGCVSLYHQGPRESAVLGPPGVLLDSQRGHAQATLRSRSAAGCYLVARWTPAHGLAAHGALDRLQASDDRDATAM